MVILIFLLFCLLFEIIEIILDGKKEERNRKALEEWYYSDMKEYEEKMDKYLNSLHEKDTHPHSS